MYMNRSEHCVYLVRVFPSRKKSLSSKQVTIYVAYAQVELTEEEENVVRQSGEGKMHSSRKRTWIWTEHGNSSSDEVTQ